eukprot:m.137066 g.137066  ORF g.137066 m.137066 type:complete len:305 (-) comp52490_c0_seq2:235-1149(-)
MCPRLPISCTSMFLLVIACTCLFLASSPACTCATPGKPKSSTRSSLLMKKRALGEAAPNPSTTRPSPVVFLGAFRSQSIISCSYSSYRSLQLSDDDREDMFALTRRVAQHYSKLVQASALPPDQIKAELEAKSAVWQTLTQSEYFSGPILQSMISSLTADVWTLVMGVANVQLATHSTEDDDAFRESLLKSAIEEFSTDLANLQSAHSSKHSGEEAFSAQLVRECLLATQSLFDDAEKHLWLKEGRCHGLVVSYWLLQLIAFVVGSPSISSWSLCWVWLVLSLLQTYTTTICCRFGERSPQQGR